MDYCNRKGILCERATYCTTTACNKENISVAIYADGTKVDLDKHETSKSRYAQYPENYNIVKQVELTPECIDEIAEAVCRKMKGDTE